MPFGQAQVSPLPSPPSTLPPTPPPKVPITPPPPPTQQQRPPSPPLKTLNNKIVDEIAALVQAEIDEIERELHRAEFRGGSDKEVVAKGDAGTVAKSDLKTSAKLLEPFSDIYYDHSFFLDDDEEEEVSRRTSTASSSSAASGFSATSMSTPRTSIESGSPRPTPETGDGYEKEYEVGDDAGFMHGSVRHAPVVALGTTAPSAARIATTTTTTTTAVSTAASIATTTAAAATNGTATTTTTTTSSSSSRSIADPEAYKRGLELFGQIRRTLTFNDTVWADIDDELESEEYTDEFDEVVEELGMGSSDAGLGAGLGKGLGLGLSGVRRGMGLGLARSFRIGTIRHGGGGNGRGRTGGGGSRDGTDGKVFSKR